MKRNKSRSSRYLHFDIRFSVSPKLSFSLSPWPNGTRKRNGETVQERERKVRSVGRERETGKIVEFWEGEKERENGRRNLDTIEAAVPIDRTSDPRKGETIFPVTLQREKEREEIMSKRVFFPIPKSWEIWTGADQWAKRRTGHRNKLYERFTSK